MDTSTYTRDLVKYSHLPLCWEFKIPAFYVDVYLYVLVFQVDVINCCYYHFKDKGMYIIPIPKPLAS